MAQPIFGAEYAVTALNRAFENTSPGYAAYANHVASAGTTAESIFAFAAQFAQAYANVSDADLAHKVLTNLGVLPSDNESVQATEPFVVDYFGAISKEDRGIAVLQLAYILSSLEVVEGEMAVYSPAAVAWNKELLASFTYSADAAHTTPFEGEHVPASPATELSLGTDHLVSTTPGTTFTAPVVQASTIGGISNTYETGDVINATGTGNKLLVDLVPVIHGVAQIGTAISATTTNIQVMDFRIQDDQVGIPLVPFESHIDAQKNAGVQEWWTTNSRQALVIEDIRTRPEDTDFGVRNTDPDRGAGLRAYFDPDQLSNTPTAVDSALTVTIDNADTPGDLSVVPINGLSFKLGGVSFTLQSDELGAATTHAEFLAELNQLLGANPALAGITATMLGANSIVLSDPQGRAFEKGGWKFINDEVPADGNIVFAQLVGEPALQDRIVSTDLILDNAGRTGSSGVVDLGSMGDGGIQTINTTVDRNSWVDAIESRGTYGTGDRFLETLNLASTGANGDLKIGAAEDPADDSYHTDGRIVDGLHDVRTVEASAFAGALSYGVHITDDSIGRYFDGATGPVQFSYEGGTKADNITVEVSAAVSGDKDFAMSVDLGAGNDRLNLDVPTVKNVTVNGGTGTNTLAMSQTQGTTAANTFKSVTNIQVYEVEASGDTAHKVTNIGGLTDVVIASDDVLPGPYDTTVIDLADGVDVTVTGKNQTATDGKSNNPQAFDTVRLAGGNGATQAVKLQNTARLDGVLTVNTLTVNDLAAGEFPAIAKDASAVRTLEIESAGARSTSNVVTTVNAPMVNTFTLTGTQNLTVGTIASAANSTAAAAAAKGNLSIDATALTGTATVGIAGGILTSLNADDKLVNAQGTAGDKDQLIIRGAVTTDNDTTISGFETVTFDNASAGSFDGTNVSGVSLYHVQSQGNTLALVDMGATETIRVNNDAAAGTQGNDLLVDAASRAPANAVTIEYRDVTPASATVVDNANVAFAGRDLYIQDYYTVTLDLGGTTLGDWANTQTLKFLDKNGIGSDNKDYLGNAAVLPLVYDASTVYTKVLNVVGGVDDDRTTHSVDSVDLGLVETVLTDIDFSGFNGDIAGMWADTTGVNSTIVVNEYNLSWNILDPVGMVPGAQEVQTLDFAASGDLQPGDSITITFAGTTYTYTNESGADQNAAAYGAAIEAAITADAALSAVYTVAHAAGMLTLTTVDNVEVIGVGPAGPGQVVGDAAATFTNLPANDPAALTVTTNADGDGAAVFEAQTITGWAPGFQALQPGESITIDFTGNAGEEYTFTNTTGAAIAANQIAAAILNDVVVLGNAPAGDWTITGVMGDVRLTSTDAAAPNLPAAVITATAAPANVAPVQAESTNGAADVGNLSEFITSFTFAEDAYAKGIVWEIDNFQAFDDVANVVGTSNLTILDLDALGVDGWADLKIQDGVTFLAGLSAADLTAYTTHNGGAPAVGAGDLVITSNEGKNFTIVLTGVTQVELTEENFGNF